MLKVTINSGNAPERSIYVNDLLDVKIVQDAVLDEFQKVLAQDDEDKNIILQRILDRLGCNDIQALDDWITESENIRDIIDSSDYCDIDGMTEALDSMKSAMEDIYYTAREYV